MKIVRAFCPIIMYYTTRKHAELVSLYEVVDSRISSSCDFYKGMLYLKGKENDSL